MIYGKRFCKACGVSRDLSDYPGTSLRCRHCLKEAAHVQALRELALPITPAEDRVAALMSKGMTNAEIGAAIHRSPGTVKNHVGAILHKLEVPNRTQAVLKYLKIKGL